MRLSIISLVCKVVTESLSLELPVGTEGGLIELTPNPFSHNSAAIISVLSEVTNNDWHNLTCR